jgi:hypothetical protein
LFFSFCDSVAAPRAMNWDHNQNLQRKTSGAAGNALGATI